MVSVTLATSEWIQFFKDAGIPAGPAVNYAVSFVDNRIQRNMLMDLTKDIMNELGIMVVGDIIAVLKHAKVVYKQELAKMATESITPTHGNVHFELKRTTGSLLSRPADPGPDNAAKRRRVTAEMEGKYKINMPQGTTAKTKKILEQQTTKGLSRMSVFDRLGAETKADTTTGSKPTGVFSRLGEVVSQRKESSDDEEVGSVLQYAGVLKRAPSAPVPESPKPPLTVKGRTGAAVTTIRRLAVPKAGGTTTPTAAAAAVPGKSGQVSRATPHHRLQSAAPAKVSIRHRLGKAMPPAADTQDNKVTSTKSRSSPEFTVTIKNTARTPVPTKVSSSTEGRMAQMDSTGTVSVFERLGMKLK
ncbi:uncharacterized protein C19orf47 homolog isoform X3 [Amblyraja radiata]|uniref:uncharacterized protein C19orf47 homolog isoform X3 n=1 Tax=Amblyraja radiata TaxID=386614 RepID=UPI001402685C|nr:uncharacterized protein C19orf47 homolog isoform X3 [Amblyraja radiata]